MINSGIDNLKGYKQAVDAMDLRRHEYDELVPIWLYSVNYHRGVRFIGQVTGEELKIMAADDNPLVQHETDAQQLYFHYLKIFDANQRLNLMEQFMFQASLLYLVSNMEIWKEAPPLAFNSGIHFVLYDWQAVNGTLNLRPQVFFSSSLVDETVLKENLNVLADGMDFKDPQFRYVTTS